MGYKEARVEQYLMKRVKEAGGLCWKFVSPGHSGVPDRVVIIDGHVEFVEVKAEDGRLSKLQGECIKTMQAAGAKVSVVWSRSDVDTYMAHFGLETYKEGKTCSSTHTKLLSKTPRAKPSRPRSG